MVHGTEGPHGLERSRVVRDGRVEGLPGGPRTRIEGVTGARSEVPPVVAGLVVVPVTPPDETVRVRVTDVPTPDGRRPARPRGPETGPAPLLRDLRPEAVVEGPVLRVEEVVETGHSTVVPGGRPHRVGSRV